MTVIKNLLFRFIPGKILILIKKWHYLRKLRNISEEDGEDLVMLKDLVHKGDQVLDISANTGVYSRFLSLHTGPSGKVHSFEPIPETYQFLENNSEWNVFKCAENLLKKTRPVLLIEINQYLTALHNKKKLLELVKKNEYSIYVKQVNKLRARKDGNNVDYCFLM